MPRRSNCVQLCQNARVEQVVMILALRKKDLQGTTDAVCQKAPTEAEI